MADQSSLQVALGKVRQHGLKYSAVSIINVAIGQGLLVVLGIIVHNAWVANILAVSISAIPAYYLTRAWVWGKSGKSHLYKEVLPFWGFAFAGLILSTVSVALATKWLGISGVPRSELTTIEKLVPNIANMAAFGVLWVVKFFVLDAYMFGKHHHGPVEDEVTEPAAV
jgi:putative flippase GtrA